MMKSVSILNRKAIRFLSVCVVLVLGMAMPLTVHAGERTYEISFRAGSNGTVNGGSSYKEDQPAGYVFDEAVTRTWVQANDGYYFTGWKEELAPVTQKAVYVAQYKRIVKEAVYRVNYVDANGNALATQKVAATNENAVVSESAPAIEGYVPEQKVIETTVAKKGTEITFRYQSANSNVVTEEVTVVVPGQENPPAQSGTTAGTTTGNAAGNTVTGAGDNTAANTAAGTQTGAGTDANVADNGTGAVEAPEQEGQGVTIPGEEVPLGENNDGTNIEDEEVPLGNNKLEEDNGIFSGKSLIWIVAAGAAVVLGGAGFFIWKVKKNKSRTGL